MNKHFFMHLVLLVKSHGFTLFVNKLWQNSTIIYICYMEMTSVCVPLQRKPARPVCWRDWRRKDFSWSRASLGGSWPPHLERLVGRADERRTTLSGPENNKLISSLTSLNQCWKCSGDQRANMLALQTSHTFPAHSLAEFWSVFDCWMKEKKNLIRWVTYI